MLLFFLKMLPLCDTGTLFPNLTYLYFHNLGESFDTDFLLPLLSALVSEKTKRIGFGQYISNDDLLEECFRLINKRTSLTHVQFIMEAEPDLSENIIVLRIARNIPTLKSFSVPVDLFTTLFLTCLSELPQLEVLEVGRKTSTHIINQSTVFPTTILDTDPEDEFDLPFSSLKTLRLFSTAGIPEVIEESGYFTDSAGHRVMNLEFDIDDHDSAIRLIHIIGLSFANIASLNFSTTDSPSIKGVELLPLRSCSRLVFLNIDGCCLTTTELIDLIKPMTRLRGLSMTISNIVMARQLIDTSLSPISKKKFKGLGLDCLEPIAEMLPLLEDLSLSIHANEISVPHYPRHQYGLSFRRLMLQTPFLNYERPGFDLYEAGRYISCIIGRNVLFECTKEPFVDSFITNKRGIEYAERYNTSCSGLEKMVRNFVRIRADENAREKVPVESI